MLTWGAIVLIVNVLYGLFAFILGKVAKRFFQRYYKHIGKVVFVVVLLAPFWDLIIQKGIKTYYQVFDVGTAIYAYPQKDADGKIESLGVGQMAGGHSSSYLETQKDLLDLKKKYSIAKKFIEYYIYNSFEKIVDKHGNVSFKSNYKVPLGYVRVHFDETPIRYEIIKNEKDYKARYQVKAEEYRGYFHKVVHIEFWDMREHKLLAKTIKVGFDTIDAKDKFRSKFLLWVSLPNGGTFVIGDYRTYSSVFKKFFNVIVY